MVGGSVEVAVGGAVGGDVEPTRETISEIKASSLELVTLKLRQNGQQKRTTGFVTLLQNELKLGFFYVVVVQ